MDSVIVEARGYLNDSGRTDLSVPSMSQDFRMSTKNFHGDHPNLDLALERKIATMYIELYIRNTMAGSFMVQTSFFVHFFD
jgi:hypothetical protein